MRSDSSSGTSSSSFSGSWKSTPRAGGGEGCGTKGRRGPGGDGRRDGDGGGDGDGDASGASDGHVSVDRDQRKLFAAPTVEKDSTAGEDNGHPPSSSSVAFATAARGNGASCSRHNSSNNSGRRSGRVACSGEAEGDDDSLGVDRAGRDGGGGVVGDAGDGSENGRGRSNGGNIAAPRAFDARSRIQPMLAFQFLVRFVVKSTRWARERYCSPRDKA